MSEEKTTSASLSKKQKRTAAARKNSLSENVYCKVINFTGHKKVFFIISLCLIVISICATFFGVDMDIEYKGGTILTYSYTGTIDEDKIQSTVNDEVKDNGESNSITVQAGENLATGGNSVTISISSKNGISDDEQSSITKDLQKLYPDGKIELIDSNSVDRANGIDFLEKSILALVFAAVILILYIAIRFRVISGWSAGVFGVTALIHDLIITYGAFIIMGFEINSNFMAVLLTILGYSINDTIVIYDRIRENGKAYPGTNINELVNVSISQTLRRSIRTSITTVSTMIIISIVAGVMGVTSILSFSLPLAVGLIVGTYSSICIAPQLWVWWNEKRNKNTVTPKAKKVKNA